MLTAGSYQGPCTRLVVSGTCQCKGFKAKYLSGNYKVKCGYCGKTEQTFEHVLQCRAIYDPERSRKEQAAHERALRELANQTDSAVSSLVGMVRDLSKDRPAPDLFKFSLQIEADCDTDVIDLMASIMDHVPNIVSIELEDDGE